MSDTADMGEEALEEDSPSGRLLCGTCPRCYRRAFRQSWVQWNGLPHGDGHNSRPHALQ